MMTPPKKDEHPTNEECSDRHTSVDRNFRVLMGAILLLLTLAGSNVYFNVDAKQKSSENTVRIEQVAKSVAANREDLKEIRATQVMVLRSLGADGGGE